MALRAEYGAERLIMNISIAKDFSDTPWGRFPTDGDFCGANFRDNVLIPALKRSQIVVVDLDGVEGVGSSFLDEAFGGLVREGQFSAEELKHRLQVVTTERPFRMYVDLIWRYIGEAAKARPVAA